MKSLCICLACLLALCSVLPASCEAFDFDFADIDDGFDLTEDFDDFAAAPVREVTLCYVASDALDFTFATRAFEAVNTHSLIDRILSEFSVRSDFNANVGGFRFAAVPDFELSGATVTVDLPIEAVSGRTSREILAACSALANSLLSVDEIRAVNLLFGNRAFRILSLPMGVFTDTVEYMTLAYADIDSEWSQVFNTDASITRDALVYYPVTTGARVVPVPVSVGTAASDWITALITALGTAPQADPVVAVPDVASQLLSEPSVTVNEFGEPVISLNFKGILPDYLALSGVDPSLFYGALVLTLTSFVPDIAGVRLYLDGAEIVSVSLPSVGEVTVSRNGFERRDFTALIGSVNTVYMRSAQDRLSPVAVVGGMHESHTARGLLKALFTAPSIAGLTSCIPEGVDETDILAIEYFDRELNVDLSAKLYTLCASLDPVGERLFVYSIVNTLCTLPGIKAISFTFEGRSVDLFINNICLSSALMPDPGLIDP